METARMLMLSSLQEHSTLRKTAQEVEEIIHISPQYVTFTSHCS